MTDQEKPQPIQATTVRLTSRCWWCSTPIPTHQGEEQANLVYIDDTHLVAFCKDNFCLTSWWNTQENVEMVFDEALGEYKVVPIDAEDSQEKGGLPSFGGGGKKEGDHPLGAVQKKEGNPPLDEAGKKRGYPLPPGVPKKRRVTIPQEGGAFTLDDVRNMKYWHPLYKELKTILKEQGHWKDLPKGGSFKPGNPHRFTTVSSNGS